MSPGSVHHFRRGRRPSWPNNCKRRVINSFAQNSRGGLDMLDKQDYNEGMENETSLPRSRVEEAACRDFARRLEGNEIKGYYVMAADGTTREVYNLLEWAQWVEAANRLVQKTKIGTVEVSTVFLGLDYNFGGEPPALFETMVFGGRLDQQQVRYATLDEAKTGHEKLVRHVRANRYREANDVRR